MKNQLVLVMLVGFLLLGITQAKDIIVDNPFNPETSWVIRPDGSKYVVPKSFLGRGITRRSDVTSLFMSSTPTDYDVNEFIVSDKPDQEGWSDVAEGLAVWMTDSNGIWEIYEKNFATGEVRLIRRSALFPATDGETHVWHEKNENGTLGVWGQNVVTRTTFKIYDLPDSNQYFANVGKNWVVCQSDANDSSDIVAIDISDPCNPVPYLVCGADGFQYRPKIRENEGNGKILEIHEDFRDLGRRDIYGNYITDPNNPEVIEIVVNSHEKHIGGIDVDRSSGLFVVVYTEDPDGSVSNLNIYAIYPETGLKIAICERPGNQIASRSSTSWPFISITDTYSDPEGDIICYDMSTGIWFSVCTKPNGQYGSAAWGNFISWTDERSGNGDVYGARISVIYDFDGDGDVDFGDFAKFANFWLWSVKK